MLKAMLCGLAGNMRDVCWSKQTRATAQNKTKKTPRGNCVKRDCPCISVGWYGVGFEQCGGLTLGEAGEEEPRVSEIHRPRTPRFCRGTAGKSLRRRRRPHPPWKSPGVSGRWSSSGPCSHLPSLAMSCGRWSPSASSSDTQILGPRAGPLPTPTSPPSFFLGNKSFDVGLKWRGFAAGLSRDDFCGWGYKFAKFGFGESNRRMDMKTEERASAGTAAPTHRRNREKEDTIKPNQTNNGGGTTADWQRGGLITFQMRSATRILTGYRGIVSVSNV